MRLSLRKRLLLLVAAVNVGVFVVGGAVLLARVRGSSELGRRALSDELVYAVSDTIRRGELNAARILDWPNWARFEDAFLVDRSLDELPGGRIETRGVALNPLGASRRDPEVDLQRVLAAMLRAVRTGEPVGDVEGGRVVPIHSPDAPLSNGRPVIWGGCWYRDRGAVRSEEVVRDLLPWFVVSTLVMTAATYWLLGRLVLRPVEALAAAAGRLRGGDFGSRVAETERHDELADLVRGFNQMAAVLEGHDRRLSEEVERATGQARAAEAAAMTQRRLAAMGELAAGIAHEVNNPLGGMINAVEVLARPDLPAEKRERYLGLLRDGLGRVRAVVGRLLSFAPRADRPEHLLLSEVAQDAIALVRYRAQRSGIEIALARPPDEPLVRGLRSELGQVLLNLLANAIDALESRSAGASAAGAASGRIDVSIERRGGALVLAVRDDGPGMPAELLPRAADLFFTTKEVGRGTGLGLAIVHRIAADHGATVELASEPGRGFTAEIAFPLGSPSGGAA